MADTVAELTKAVRDNRGWFIALGIILLIVGTAAIVFPFISTLSTTVLIGWVLVIGGIVQIIHAFGAKGWGGFFWEAVIGVLETIFGLILLAYPIAGIIALTLFLAAMFFVEGIVRTVFSFQIRPQAGWGWLLASGIISIIVGVMLWAKLPSSALWAIGLLVGINFIMAGWSLLMLAFAAEKSAGAEAKA
jgi:uncharacterized membrane protein HdeD (DUF308 family)